MIKQAIKLYPSALVLIDYRPDTNRGFLSNVYFRAAMAERYKALTGNNVPTLVIGPLLEKAIIQKEDSPYYMAAQFAAPHVETILQNALDVAGVISTPVEYGELFRG